VQCWCPFHGYGKNAAVIPQAILFDLDGTLARTNDVDRECYAQALLEIVRIAMLGSAILAIGQNSHQ